MSSTDERILQSVDDVISSIDRLLEEIQAAPDISLIQKNLAVQKASEVTVFLDEINGILVPGATAHFDADRPAGGEAFYEESDVAGVESPQAQLQPRLIITPVEPPSDDDTTGTGRDELPQFNSDIHGDHEAETDAGQFGLEEQKADAPLQEAREPSLLETENGFDAVSDNVVDEQVRDDLTLIHDVDEETEALLNGQGVLRFEHIIGLTSKEIVDLSVLLGDPARISRENWIEQAALLDKNVPTRYASQYMEADVFDRSKFNDAYLTAGRPVVVPGPEVAQSFHAEDEKGDVIFDADVPQDVFAKEKSIEPVSDLKTEEHLISEEGLATNSSIEESSDEDDPVDAETARLMNERALLEAELAKLKAELAAHQVTDDHAPPARETPQIELSTEVPFELNLDAALNDDALEEVDDLTEKGEETESAASERDKFSSYKPSSSPLEDDIYADAAALASEEISEKDLARGAMWHEEVSMGANYVPPVDDEPDDGFDEVKSFDDPAGITEAAGHSVFEEPHHAELSDLAQAFASTNDIDLSASQGEEPFHSQDISLPKTAGEPLATHGEDREAVTDTNDGIPASMILPFPAPHADGEISKPMGPPVEFADRQEGDNALPSEPLGPRSLKENPLAKKAKGGFVNKPLLPPRGPQTRGLPPFAGPLKDDMKEHPLSDQPHRSGLPPVDSKLPPLPPRPPAFQNGARLPLMKGEAGPGGMPPPVPPVPPVDGSLVGRPRSYATPGPIDDVYKRNEDEAQGKPERDELPLSTLGHDERPDQTSNELPSSDEEDASSSLGQYLARKRANSGGPQFRSLPEDTTPPEMAELKTPPATMPPFHKSVDGRPPLANGAPLPPPIAGKMNGDRPLPPQGLAQQGRPPKGMPPKGMLPAGAPNGAPGQPAPLPPNAPPHSRPQAFSGRPAIPGFPGAQLKGDVEEAAKRPVPSLKGQKPPVEPDSSLEQAPEDVAADKKREKARVSDGFHTRARNFAETLERSFQKDKD